MAEGDINGFDDRDAARIGEVVRFVERDPRYARRRRRWDGPGGVAIVQGRLTSSITAASPDGLTGPTTFTFKRWTPDPTDAHDPQYFTQSATDTVGVNRSQMTSASGRYVICANINGEWIPILVDC